MLRKKPSTSHKINSKKKIFSIPFIIFLIFVFLFSFGAPFAYDSYKLYKKGIESKATLEKGIDLITQGDFVDADELFQNLEGDLDDLYFELKKFENSSLINKIPITQKNHIAIINLLKASKQINIAIKKINSIGQDSKNLYKKYEFKTFNSLSIQDKNEIIQFIVDLEPQVNSILTDLTYAEDWLTHIPAGTLATIKEPIDQAHQKLAQAKNDIDNIHTIIQFAPYVLGHPEPKKYLLLLLNNTELRPGGGFIGTYGFIEIDNAEITKLYTDNVYNLTNDIERPTAPEVFQKYLKVQDFNFRDSNWAPDFSDSAPVALQLYKRQGGLEENIDGVIAFNPNLVTELIDFYGGITYKGTEYTAQNLVDILQYKVEQEYAQLGISEADRKAIIAELALVLTERIKNSQIQDYLKLLDIVVHSFNKKDILAYDKTPVLRSILREKNWDGRLEQIEQDYFMVVDANLASLKTDAVMNKKALYSVEPNQNGYQATIKLEYTNTGNFDWKTTRYNSYTRVYIPKGSTLIKTSNNIKNSLKQQSYKNKTEIGFYWTTEPQQKNSVELTYQLPQEIVNQIKQNNYQLYIQKQPGNQLYIAIDANFEDMIKSLHINSSKLDQNTPFLLEEDTQIYLK